MGATIGKPGVSSLSSRHRRPSASNAMASPDGLRLYFGNRLPLGVLDIIFQYGFHLWLAKPVDVIYTVHLPCPDHIQTTRAVLAESLSERTRRLVQFDRYFSDIAIGEQIRSDLGVDDVDWRELRIEYARPRKFAGLVRTGYPDGTTTIGWTVYD